MSAREPSYDERAYAARVARARDRYVQTYGAPPAGELPGACAHLDACERIGCSCSAQRPWGCVGAVDAWDGRCPCACHEAT